MEFGIVRIVVVRRALLLGGGRDPWVINLSVVFVVSWVFSLFLSFFLCAGLGVDWACRQVLA